MTGRATPTPEPVTGRVDLSGLVETEPPGTLVASGAEITSALAPQGGRAYEFYAIEIGPGDRLHLQASFDIDGNCSYCPVCVGRHAHRARGRPARLALQRPESRERLGGCP